METGQLKQKIVEETMILMSLKVDNEAVVKQTFRSIWGQLESLRDMASGQNELYTKAFDLAQSGMDEEYKQFDEAASYDEKEQVLIQLRHKAAEVCAILQSA